MLDPVKKKEVNDVAGDRQLVLPHLIESLNCFNSCIGFKVGNLVSRLANGSDAQCACAAENNNIKKRVCACRISVSRLRDSPV